MKRSFIISILLIFSFVPTTMAVNFQIGPNSYWLVGDGYDASGSTDTVQNSPQPASAGTLDVEFHIDGGLSGTTFSLNNPGDSDSFTFGTIELQYEWDITAAETDALGVTAYLDVFMPEANMVQNVATVGIVTGLTNDDPWDYRVIFDPVTVSFGNGGAYTFDLTNRWWFDDQVERTYWGTVTYVAESVPEPATMLLIGTGFIGLAVLGRKRLLKK